MPIGPIMLDIAGTCLSKEDEKILQNPLVGGVILFSRNYESLEQLQKLIYNIRNCRKNPILIAVDQEGGRVQRFRDNFTELPANRKLGEIYDKNKDDALNYADEMGWLMASEMLSVGIDLSFAPVLDLDTGSSSVIKDRGFHSEPTAITEIATAYISGMHQAGMAAVGKHFPGHGSVTADSHIAVPHDARDIVNIAEADLIPFSKLAQQLDAVMPAHIIYEKVDSLPAGFSSIWLQEILRNDCFFTGAIFSDDLTMKGAEVIGDYPTRAKTALTAGCDMVLVCNNRPAAIEIVAALVGHDDPRSQQRLLKLCGHFLTTFDELRNTSEWLEARAIAKELNLVKNN